MNKEIAIVKDQLASYLNFLNEGLRTVTNLQKELNTTENQIVSQSNLSAIEVEQLLTKVAVNTKSEFEDFNSELIRVASDFKLAGIKIFKLRHFRDLIANPLKKASFDKFRFAMPDQQLKPLTANDIEVFTAEVQELKKEVTLMLRGYYQANINLHSQQPLIKETKQILINLVMKLSFREGAKMISENSRLTGQERVERA